MGQFSTSIIQNEYASEVKCEVEVNNELRSHSGSSCGEEDRNRSNRGKFSEFNVETDLSDPKFKLGMFGSAFEFRLAIKEHVIKNNKSVNFIKMIKTLLELCVRHHMNESFIVGCNLIRGPFKLGHIDEHKCDKVYNNFHVNSSWLAQKYLNKFKFDPKWKLRHFIDMVREGAFEINFEWQHYRTKNNAIKFIEGFVIEKYGIL